MKLSQITQNFMGGTAPHKEQFCGFFTSTNMRPLAQPSMQTQPQGAQEAYSRCVFVQCSRCACVAWLCTNSAAVRALKGVAVHTAVSKRTNVNMCVSTRFHDTSVFCHISVPIGPSLVHGIHIAMRNARKRSENGRQFLMGGTAPHSFSHQFVAARARVMVSCKLHYPIIATNHVIQYFDGAHHIRGYGQHL